MLSNGKRLLYLVSLAYLSQISACTLLQKPNPPIRLQLALDVERIRWPAGLSLGKLQAAAALKSDRIIVVRGAVVMQHAGVRWVSTLDQLLTEQVALLHRASTAQISTRATSLQNSARMDIWVSEFNVTLMPDNASAASVALTAALTCQGKSTQQLPLSRESLPLSSSDPQRLASRFNEAASTALAQLLKSAEHHCRLR